MKNVFSAILGLVMALAVTACQAGPSQLSVPTATSVTLAEKPTQSDTPTATVGSSTNSILNIAELKAVVGYDVREPNIVPDGYVLEKVTVDEPTRSVCLQYRYPDDYFNNVLLVAQGPVELASPLAVISGWPEYAVLNDPFPIDGAENSFHVTGWRRDAWACTAEAEAERSDYSFTVAPQFTWEFEHQQFDLYSASGGCGTPGGLTSLDLLHVAEGLTGTFSPAAGELDPDCLHSVADAEKLAGFDVREPSYLPEKAAFYFATYQATPGPSVILRFFHEEHSDMGTFFQITQQVESDQMDENPFASISCDDVTCETIQIATTPVNYASAGTWEQLDWHADGFYFSLFRNAGEPEKVYKDELAKIVGSLK